LNRGLALAVVTAGIILFGGCGGSNQPSTPAKAQKKIELRGGTAIAYAYMKDGTELVKVSTVRKEPEEGIEIIRITRRGFYPDYLIPSGGSTSCVYSALLSAKKSDKNYKFCHSHYAVSTMGGKAMDIFGNALMTIGTAGLNAATGTVNRVMDFDEEKFLEAVEENDLPRYREAILELRQLAKKSMDENRRLYRDLYRKYVDHAKTVTVKQETVDVSGLLPEGERVDVKYRVRTMRPKAMRFSYDTDIHASPKEFDSVLAAKRKEILSKSEEDRKSIHTYLAKEASSYKLQVPKEALHRYNNHIVFHALVEAPETIPYTPDRPVEVTIVSKVDYADLYYMLPQQMKLQDSNLEALFRPSSDFGFVEAIAANRTKSFVTLKTLTIYYNGSVNSNTEINREIAPESVTLSSNSQYLLLPGDQKKITDFPKMTRKKVESVTLDYGYALKYRIENTNVDRSIYKTDKFRLYDIYRSYL